MKYKVELFISSDQHPTPQDLVDELKKMAPLPFQIKSVKVTAAKDGGEPIGPSASG